MTDRIDLDEVTDETDEPDEAGNRGDWLWRDDDEPAADADDEAAASADSNADSSAPHSGPTDGGDSPDERASGGRGASAADDETREGDPRPAPDGPADEHADVAAQEAAAADAARERIGDAVPHVPRSNQDRPVGIPKEGGGAGGATARDQSAEGADAPETETTDGRAGDPEAAGTTAAGGADDAASGPHGGGTDDMTMALTYRAARRFENPAAVFADAARWADWVGIVGEVEAHVINKFQRDHTIDADFFNGSGTAPDERLAGIDHHSMFYADRMVVVGLDDESWIAEAADWEFVPLSTAASEAGWDLAGDADESDGTRDTGSDDAAGGEGRDGAADASDTER
ncbi:MAG: hypothetical protein ABEJ05_09670 [Haloglomus sp.]